MGDQIEELSQKEEEKDKEIDNVKEKLRDKEHRHRVANICIIGASLKERDKNKEEEIFKNIMKINFSMIKYILI